MDLAFRIYKHMSIHGYTVARVYVTNIKAPHTGYSGAKCGIFPMSSRDVHSLVTVGGCWWLAKMFLVASGETLD
jgi:hypothetical protein